MSTKLKAEIEARIVMLAKRLGLSGPNAAEQVLDMALDYLDDSTAEPKRLYARERTDAVEQENAAHMAKHGYLDEDTNRPKGIPP